MFDVARVIVFAKDLERTPIEIAFRSDDVDADRGKLVARGASMGPVRHLGTLALCDGIDPEGNVFQLSSRS